MASRTKYFDQETKAAYVPYVIEPSLGVDRSMLAFIVDAYDTEEVEGRKRTVLRLHPRLAPVKVAVLPLVSKDGMPERARDLRIRADQGAGRVRRGGLDRPPLPPPGRDRHAVGITVDGQTREDDTVTLRDRDTLEQVRVPVEGLADRLAEKLAEPWSANILTTP